MLANYRTSPDVLKQVENAKKNGSGKKLAEEWFRYLYLREDDCPFPGRRLTVSILLSSNEVACGVLIMESQFRLDAGRMWKIEQMSL